MAVAHSQSALQTDAGSSHTQAHVSATGVISSLTWRGREHFLVSVMATFSSIGLVSSKFFFTGCFWDAFNYIKLACARTGIVIR